MPRQQYYGIIGNGETCALVSPTAEIDWLCLPKFDGNIVYSRALDRISGQSFGLSLLDNNRELLVQNTKQAYIPKTNVLQTTISFKQTTMTITDFFPWKQRFLFRIVSVKNLAPKTRRFSIRVNSGIGSSQKKFKDLAETQMISKKPMASLGIYLKPENFKDFKLKEGGERNASLVLAYSETARAVRGMLNRAKYIDPELEFGRAVKFWQDWMDRGKRIKLDHMEFSKMLERRLLTMKLLIFEKTGAMIAAPTASFPAVPAGTDNWDYRFCWIRDSYFMSRALLMTGHFEEVKRQLRFFYFIQGNDGHWKQPFYTINGKTAPKEMVLKKLRGPNMEEIIRVNNGAKNQLQLDSEGSVLHTTYLYYVFTQDVEMLEHCWTKIRKAANWIQANYNRPENGIWEFRERKEHWVYGKVLCFVGLESAIRMANVLGHKYPDSWEKTRSKMKSEITRNAWSEQRQAFLQNYDEDAQIDISVLAVEDYGLVEPGDRKMRATLKLIEEKLIMDKGAVKRYEDAVLPFFLPTLWLVSHYIRSRNLAKARKMLLDAIEFSTDLYLCAEHFDQHSGQQHGNFPQAFCMSSFVEQIMKMTEDRNVLETLMGTVEDNINFIVDLVKKLNEKVVSGFPKIPGINK